MAKKSKSKNNGPRRKNMTRPQRLHSAKSTSWLKKYTGKNPIAGCRNWFGVDILCTLAELKMLGFKVAEDREEQIKKSVVQEALGRQRRKAKKAEELAKKDAEDLCFLSDWESEFEYIAGYTSGGAPYGLLKRELDDGTCPF